MKASDRIAEMMKDPFYQQEALHKWSMIDGAMGQLTALHQSDYKPAIVALRASLDKIYRDMAVEEETGIAAIPDYLKSQA